MKKTFTKNFGLVFILVCTFLLQTPKVLGAFFKDVPDSYVQSKAINVLQLSNVISGYADKTFKPDKLVTRGEFLKMIFNDVGYRAAPNMGKTGFSDVPADSWIAPYVKKALDLNILSASGTNPVFNPGEPINRATAVKIAFQISGISAPYYNDIDPSELFNDVSAKAWYGYLARAAKIYNIVTVKSPNTFWANHLMTRGDAAELIYEVQEVREANDGTVSGSVSIAPPGDAIDSGDATTNALLNNPKFSILLNVWKRANTDFYYQKDVNQDELVYGAVQGMVGKLKDPYTIFEEPSDAADLQQYLQGQFEGIGTVMNLVNGKIVVVKTLAGSPAEKAGIKIGDVIEKINGQDISKLTEAQVLDEIRGNAGTTVHLTLLRNNSEIDVDVTRAKITISSVNGTVINGIADISIDEFTENSANDFTGTLENVNKQSPKGYIIDLRGNPGGYLESAVQMLGHFIETGKTVVSTKDNQGNVHAIQTTGAAELKGKPIVILVDGETASAAEIMAGALQDYKIGKLVGVKTFGKGSVQEISNYSDDSLLKITVAHWLTPNGRDINGVGLTPDINAELDQTQLLQGKDSQLQKAIDTINSMSPTS